MAAAGTGSSHGTLTAYGVKRAISERVTGARTNALLSAGTRLVTPANGKMKSQTGYPRYRPFRRYDGLIFRLTATLRFCRIAGTQRVEGCGSGLFLRQRPDHGQDNRLALIRLDNQDDPEKQAAQPE